MRANRHTGHVHNRAPFLAVILGFACAAPGAGAPAEFDLYVTGAGGVQRYDGETGVFIETFVSPGSGGLESPEGLSFGPDGNLYVGDDLPLGFDVDVVRRYDGQTGAFIDTFTGPYSVVQGRGLAFGPNDDLYFADWDLGHVVHYDGQTGAVLAFLYGSGGATDVAFDASGCIYASSFGSPLAHLVVDRWSLQTGEFLGAFASIPDTTNPGRSLCFGPDGNLYVSGQLSASVFRFDRQTGNLIDEFVAPGSGGLSDPGGLTFGPDGHLYVCSRGTDSVLRYDGRSGTFIDVFTAGGPGGAAFLRFYPEPGPLGACCYDDGSCAALMQTACSATWLGVGTTCWPNPCPQPLGACCYDDGSCAELTEADCTGQYWGDNTDCDPNPCLPHLYVSGAGGVQRYDGQTGVFIETFVAHGSGGLESPQGLAFGPDGNLYVADDIPGACESDDDVVRRFDGQTGAFIDTFADPAYVAQGRGLAFGPNDDLYFADQCLGHVVHYNGQTGAVLGFLNGSGAATDVAFNASGCVYASSFRGLGELVVDRWSLQTGEFLGVFASIPGTTNHGRSLCFGPDRNLYVCGASSASIFRFDGQTGDLIREFVTPGSGGLSDPGGLTFGPDGNLYVCSRGTGSVLRYDGRTGVFIDVFTTGGPSGAAFLRFYPELGPLGACCDDDGWCAELLQTTCTGTWLGAGTTCRPNPCLRPGACCYPDGSCTLATQVGGGDCTGRYWGDNTDCDPNPCLEPVLYVDADAVGSGNGRSWVNAFTSVQAALNVAYSGDQVWVATGRYVGDITLALDVALYGGFAGMEDPATFDLADRDFVANETILDADYWGSVVTGPPGATATTRIDGFTITNGIGTVWNDYLCGGGFFLRYSSPTIAHCLIVDNFASFGGGGFSIWSSPTITGCLIASNDAFFGGGLCSRESAPTIANCTITGNGSTMGGPSEAAMLLWDSTAAIADTIVAFNVGGIGSYPLRGVALSHNCVYGNWPCDYCDLPDPTGTNGNISEDPLFARAPDPGPDGWWGTADDDLGDLHLRWNSPCIDAGDNAHVIDTHDLDGRPRIADGDGDGTATVDMGAYETRAVTAICLADSNCDGFITWRDIDYFVAAQNNNVPAWEAMFSPGVPACCFGNNDVNADGTVSWRDIGPFVTLLNSPCP